MQEITSYDILNQANNELTILAANCGIDWDKAYSLINRIPGTIKRGIELEKKYRGTVEVLFDTHRARSGQEYLVHISIAKYKKSLTATNG